MPTDRSTPASQPMLALSGTILVADVGGTNTRIALCENGALIEGSQEKFKNSGFDSLQDLISAYVAAQQERPITGACAAVAGPVSGGQARLTNLAWDISEPDLASASGAPVALLLNDLQAQGYAIEHLPSTDIQPILGTTAPAPDAGTRLVMGLGTGMNAVLVHHVPGHGTYVPASECGHITLPTQCLAAPGLSNFLAQDHGFAAAEDALSGRGLAALYAYASGAAPTERPFDSAAVFAAESEGDAAASRAVRLFVQCLGAVLGDLALIALPRGGIYLVGGMARAIAPLCKTYDLAQAMQAKGRFGKEVAKFPLKLVQNDDAALIGAAAALAQLRG